MNVLLIENAVVLVSAVIAFVYGANRYLRPKMPLYASMIVMGTACIMLGRTYQCVRLLTGGSITENFQVGVLGVVGAFAFFFSANFGQIDSLVDDGSKAFRRYRMIGLAGPVLIGLLGAAAMTAEITVAGKCVCGLVSVMIGIACYYHVKHIFIPDVDYGVVKCLRKYNALAFCFGLLHMAEMIALSHAWDQLLIGISALIAAAVLCMIIAMDRGVKAWRT